MTSLRQLETNRRNAQRSTGPRTEEGKEVSRRNVLRHGVTAETVIEILEDPEDYKAFEANITADYDAQSAVERELVLRLASLLWRIRRATGIETDLLRIQAEILRERAFVAQQSEGTEPPPPNPLYRALRAVIPPRWTCNGSPDEIKAGNGGVDETGDEANAVSEIDYLATNTADPSRTLSFCFLRLANLDGGAFKRLNRYETALWRQAVQTMFVLRTIRHKWPV